MCLRRGSVYESLWVKYVCMCALCVRVCEFEGVGVCVCLCGICHCLCSHVLFAFFFFLT